MANEAYNYWDDTLMRGSQMTQREKKIGLDNINKELNSKLRLSSQREGELAREKKAFSSENVRCVINCIRVAFIAVETIFNSSFFRGGNKLEGWNQHKHTTMYKVDNQQGLTLQYRELKTL